jgi:hypothetical protein
MPIRVGFVIEGQKTICPITAIKRFIKIAKQAEPNMTFHPAEGKTGPSFSNVEDAPDSEEDFKRFFTLHEHVKRPGFSNQHEVCLQICTNRTLNDIKNEGQNNKTVLALQKGRIHVDTDEFHAKRIVGVGGLFGIHPRALNRNALASELEQTLQTVTLTDATRADIRRTSVASTELEDNDWEIDARAVAPITLSTRKFSYGATNRITTEAIAVECAAEDAKLTQARLAAAMSQALMPKGMKFIPRAAARHMGEEHYRKLLQDQAAMMRQSVSVPISGVTATAMTYDIEIEDDNGFTTSMTLKQAIERNNKIRRVEPTNDTRNGKWLLITEKRFEADVQQYADEHLSELFRQLPDAPGYRAETWNQPSRSDKPYTNDEEAQVYAMLHADATQSIILEDDQATPNSYKRTSTHNKRKHGAIQFYTKGEKSYASVASKKTVGQRAQTAITHDNTDTDFGRTQTETNDVDNNMDSEIEHRQTASVQQFTETMEIRMTQWMTNVEQKIEAQTQPTMNEILQAMQQTIQNTVKDLMTSLTAETFKHMEIRMAANEQKLENANRKHLQEIETLQATIKHMQNPGIRSPSRLPQPTASKIIPTASATRARSGSP